MATLYYLAHDPVSNSEVVLTEYDSEIIRLASESGIVFISVDENGERAVVPASEVHEPEAREERFTFVQPLYVDDRLKAVVKVFDALAASASTAVAASVDAQSVSGKARSAAGFADALEALRSLVYGTGEEGGAQ